MGGKVMMVMVVVVVTLLQTRPTNAANIFTAFNRGFEDQEEIQTTLLETGRGWELREVPAKVWACTKQQRPAHHAPVTTAEQMAAFLRLFGYLNGRNSRAESLPMGKPVSIEVKAAEGEEDEELSACFFLPERVQPDLPTPSDPRVYLSPRPSLTVYTRQFGGFASSEGDWTSQGAALRAGLEEGRHTLGDLQYWNAFDPPHKFWYRRNEVWLVKAEEEESSNL